MIIATTESEMFCKTPKPCQGSSSPLLKTILLAVPMLRPPQLQPNSVVDDAIALVCKVMMNKTYPCKALLTPSLCHGSTINSNSVNQFRLVRVIAKPLIPKATAATILYEVISLLQNAAAATKLYEFVSLLQNAAETRLYEVNYLLLTYCARLWQIT